MNKKLKIAIPFAVLTLTCGISAGVLAGCDAHEHSYTLLKNDGETHVMVCPDDGVADESTRAPHEFFGGECECGADENAGKVFSTASGKIKLHKLGGYETDYTGVTVDFGDDDVIVNYDEATGEYTVEDALVGKTYNLRISKAGYKDYTTVVKVSEGKNTVIGGTNGAVLEYDAFGLLNDYDGNYHDFSHVNEESPYINFLENDGSKTLNVLSNDKYSEVSATMHLEFDNSLNGLHTQGIVIKFEDGKHVIVRYHNGDQANGNIQYVKNLWDLQATNTLLENIQFDEWGEAKLRDLTSSETKAIKADGIDLTVMVKDGAIHTFLGGRYIESVTLPEGYADKKAQVGYFVFNTASNASVYYNVDESVPEELQCNLDISVSQPDGAGCTVEKNVGGDVFALTDRVELTFNAPDGYRLSELTVAGEDMYGEVVDRKLTIATDRLNLDVVAVFSEIKDVELNITVKGKKLGETYNLAAGTEVKFKNTEYTFTVGENGLISNAAVTEGRYTVVVDGYFEQEINFVEGFDEVTLDYDTFQEILHWGSFDFKNQNVSTPSFGITNDCSVVLTKDTYETAMASIYLKGDNQNGGTGGLVFRFVGNGMANNGETVSLIMQGTKKVQFSMDNLWGQTTIASGLEWKNLIYFEDCNDDGMDRVADEHAQEYLDAYNNGTLKLSVVREGSTFYVYLNGRFVGVQTVDAKYANAKCEVGFITSNLGDSSSWKYWNVEITEDVIVRQAATLTDGTTDTNGTVTLPTGDVKVGDTVQLSVAPNAGYLIKKLTVNGVDVTSTITVVKETKAGTCGVEIFGNTTVVAEFEEIAYGSVESSVSLYKLGETVALTDGAEVTLSNSDFTYKATVTGGKINLTQVAVGTYTVSTDGALNGTITVTADKYAEAIVLEYNLLNNLPSGWNWGDAVDLSKQNEGEVTQTNGLTLWVATNDTYDNVSITVNVKNDVTSVYSRQGVMIKFGNDYVMVQLEKIDKDNNPGNYKISWNADTGYAGWGTGVNNITDSWDELGENLTSEQAASGEYEVTLTRIGNVIYASVNGEYCGKLTIDEKYADQKCQVGIYATDIQTGAVRQFSIVENAVSPETND